MLAIVNDVNKKLWVATALSVLMSGSLAWTGLQGKPGPLKVDSSPPGARVLVDGVCRGFTPCQVSMQGTRGHLELDKEGFLPVLEVIRPRPVSSGELHFTMRPGVRSHAHQPPETIPGCYPPARGKPPASFLQSKNRLLQGHAYAVPAEWSERHPSEDSVSLDCGDGQKTPRRHALLSVQPRSSLTDRVDAVRELRECDGWATVAVFSWPGHAMLRFERTQGLVTSRAAVLLELNGDDRLLQLDYDYPNCADIFEYTRDLDVLRASLDLAW